MECWGKGKTSGESNFGFLSPPTISGGTHIIYFQASSSAPAPAMAVPGDSSFPSCISARVFLPLPGNQQRALQQTTEKQQARKRKVLETLLCTKSQTSTREGSGRAQPPGGREAAGAGSVDTADTGVGLSKQPHADPGLEPPFGAVQGGCPKTCPRQGLPPHQGRHVHAGAPCHQQRLQGKEGLSPWFLLLPQAGCHIFLLTNPL